MIQTQLSLKLPIKVIQKHDARACIRKNADTLFLNVVVIESVKNFTEGNLVFAKIGKVGPRVCIRKFWHDG